MKMSKLLAGTLVFGILFSVFILPAASFSSVGREASISATWPYQQQPVTSPEGEALYKQRCAVCHDNPQDRIPPLFLIRRRSAEDVMQTLTSGSMKQQASWLSADQVRALAVYLTGKQPGAPIQGNLEVNRCN